MSTTDPGKRIGIFMSFSGEGGVERMVSNLAQGMLDAGYQVDFVLARAQGRHLASIPDGVRLIKLDKRHTLGALPGLTAYLRREKPSALLAAKDRAIRVAILARFFARSDVFLAGRIGTTVSAALEGRNLLKRIFWHLGMKFFYRFTDLIVAVSEGVAKDVIQITSLPASQVTVISNPVITPVLQQLAEEPVSYPWFEDLTIPIIMGMGRLTRQKDFTTLIKAFAIVRETRKCRLLILGEGADRKDIETLAIELKICDDVNLPGFKSNPYAYLAKSSLFVLSSRWEGSPNALTEALALGRPVVSTDCPSGPSEILQDGKYGKLVPVGDVCSMAAAMSLTLDSPPESEYLRGAVEEYSVQKSTASYLKAMGLN
ncbi:MAG: glycosyltransferase [bacterium]|nr:glycosyltransferase [bacterium]MDT8365284.1 glycosyltransferase [bacterium]